MGDHSWTHIAAWTYLCSVWIIVCCGANRLLEDLDLEVFPDVTKINISQDEYTRMMTVYLDRLRDSTTYPDHNGIPILITFNSERKSWRRRRDGVAKLHFPVNPVSPEVDVESSDLRLLAPAIPGLDSVHVRVYQLLGTRRRRFVADRVVYPSAVAPKWWDFDVTSATHSWMIGERNLGLEVECVECRGAFQPLRASVSALVLPRSNRVRRSSSHHGTNERRERTDCKSSDTKRKCCRHTWRVYFKDLHLAEMNSILQPKFYEAGYCRGRCPVNYNHATNHSRIQSIVHKMNKTVPRVCCAPSKLAGVEILRVDPYDHNKLYVETWDNMSVLECACS